MKNAKRVSIDRDAAINNIAFCLYQRGLLTLPPPANPHDRLEPFLTLSPVVSVIADGLDAATFRQKGRQP